MPRLCNYAAYIMTHNSWHWQGHLIALCPIRTSFNLTSRDSRNSFNSTIIKPQGKKEKTDYIETLSLICSLQSAFGCVLLNGHCFLYRLKAAGGSSSSLF